MASRTSVGGVAGGAAGVVMATQSGTGVRQPPGTNRHRSRRRADIACRGVAAPRRWCHAGRPRREGRRLVTDSRTRPRDRVTLAVTLLLGFAVALAVGGYARVHDPALRPLFLVGFSSMLPMKAWLASAALLLVLLQLLSALWLWGRLPGMH